MGESSARMKYPRYQRKTPSVVSMPPKSVPAGTWRVTGFLSVPIPLKAWSSNSMSVERRKKSVMEEQLEKAYSPMCLTDSGTVTDLMAHPDKA